jgi:hypothetical protein
VLLIGSGAALAQGGSVGGNLGQTNKSISGGQAESPPPAPARRAAPPRPVRSAPARVDTGSVGSVSGSWGGISTGSCIPNWSWTIQIGSDGTMSGSGANGHVSRGGAASGIMTVGGTDYHFVGHFGGSAGSGTWTTAAGCSGHWTAAKS